eukprot:XP_001703535.1 predicted protein [Chlamydomonas reinhardtii]
MARSTSSSSSGSSGSSSGTSSHSSGSRSSGSSPSRSPPRGRAASKDEPKANGGRSNDKAGEGGTGAGGAARLVVSNLTRNVTEDHVREIFGCYGSLKEVRCRGLGAEGGSARRAFLGQRVLLHGVLLARKMWGRP